jgi:cytochrome c-type biogenesis protein CcmH/NrfG
LEEQSPENWKESGRNAMKKGDFSTALNAFQRAEGGENDL